MGNTQTLGTQQDSMADMGNRGEDSRRMVQVHLGIPFGGDQNLGLDVPWHLG